MGNGELKALLKLLDESDPEIFRQVREKLLSMGTEAIPEMEALWENTFDPLIQQRIEEIIHQIQLAQLRFDLTNWQLFGSSDLIRGFMLITRFQYPEIQENELTEKIEQLKWDIWLELNDQLTALESIKVVNHVLFDIHKYAPNRLKPSALQNFFFNNLLETKRGNPISLGILYQGLCNRLNLPVYGVDLPQHFILAWAEQGKLLEGPLPPEKKEAMFYINPFKKGVVFTRNEVELYLKQLHLEPSEAFFRPCNNVTVITRLIETLASSYRSFNINDKAAELDSLGNLLK